jgi:hypothetical protein
VRWSAINPDCPRQEGDATMKTEDFRVLDHSELAAVSGGACVTEATVHDIKGKGELEVGFTECDGMPGVKIPYARWTPTKPKPKT